jgi:hypothetical protein
MVAGIGMDHEREFEAKRGRPATGESRKINQRIPADLDSAIQAVADFEFIPWGEALLLTIKRGLNGGRK